MKKTLLTLAAIPAATMAVEASAQTYVNTGGTMGIQNRIATLDSRITAGVQAGAISRSEEQTLRRQLQIIDNMQRQYSANGLSQSERRTLQQRLRTVRTQLRNYYGRGYAWNDSQWDNWNYTYPQGYGSSNVTYDQYGRPMATGGMTYDQYGRPMATGRVTYDQYGRPIATGGVTYDQYGRPVANGYYGQGGPYEPVRTNPIGSMLGGVLGSGGGGLLSGILGGGGLRVGDVITSTIGNVLSGGSMFGSRYRDTNSTYFRSDGQRVYEIDARTNQVIRIHPMR